MLNNMKRLGLGAGVGLTSWLLGRAYSMFAPEGGLATATFSALPLRTLDVNVQQQVLSGVNQDLASKILSFLGGGVVEVLPSFVMAMIAGIVVVFLGAFVVDALMKSKIPLPTGKKPLGKLAAVLFYGTLIGGLVVGWMSDSIIGALPTIGAAVSMIIYFMIVGVVYNVIQRNLLKQLPALE